MLLFILLLKYFHLLPTSLLQWHCYFPVPFSATHRIDCDVDVGSTCIALLRCRLYCKSAAALLPASPMHAPLCSNHSHSNHLSPHPIPLPSLSYTLCLHPQGSRVFAATLLLLLCRCCLCYLIWQRRHRVCCAIKKQKKSNNKKLFLKRI